MTERSNTKSNYSRRDALRLMALGGAAGLIAPNLLGKPAFAQNPPASPTGRVVVGFSQEPTVFNPLMPHTECDDAVHFSVFDALVRMDPKGVLQPNLAVEVPSQDNGGISEDGLVWRIRLRDDVRWHDGTPFTAEDVKFTLELITNPKFRAWRTAGHSLVRDIKVVSPTELTWRMEEAFAPYLSFLAETFMVPKHILEKEADPNAAAFNQAPVGTGAFKWAQRTAGDHIELVANADYAGEGPYLERLVFKYIPDMTVLYTQFKSGDIDLVDQAFITADHYAEASTLPDRVVMLERGASVELIYLNLEKPQFKDPAVRQALYAAIDRKAILEALYYGVHKPTETFMPQNSYYYNPNLPAQEFNLERAGQILDEAGWVPGADGIRVKDGVRLSFANSTTSGNHLREQTQQFLQQTFAEIGVEMTISNLPAAVMWGDFWLKSQFEVSDLRCNQCHRGRPRRFQPPAHQGDRREGRKGLEHRPILQPGGRCAARQGHPHLRSGSAARHLSACAGNCSTGSAVPASVCLRQCVRPQGRAGRFRGKFQRPRRILACRRMALEGLTYIWPPPCGGGQSSALS